MRGLVIVTPLSGQQALLPPGKRAPETLLSVSRLYCLWSEMVTESGNDDGRSPPAKRRVSLSVAEAAVQC